MKHPILVIHGVATRDEAAFARCIEELAEHLDPSADFIPVYWGDLGAELLGITDVIPTVRDIVRGEEVDAFALLAAATAYVVRSEEAIDIVAAAASAQISRSQREVREESLTAEFRSAIAAEWETTKHLRAIRDRELLEAVGELLALEIGGAAPIPASRYATRGDEDEDALERAASDLGKRVREGLRIVDRIVGRSVQVSVGSAYAGLRDAYAAAGVQFIGDIFVYQRHRSTIHQRIRDVLAQRAPNYATPEQPIDILAHSLGGVIAFDAALLPEHPLWIRTLVTIGSQPALFHVADPREGIASYVPPEKVALPQTIRRWINLWEPLDPLAFSAAIFRTGNGKPPEDRRVEHLATYGLQTHGVYWKTDELRNALAEVLR